MDNQLLDIGEVARRTGRAPSALRFWERKGLIRSVDRKGLRRAFTPDVLDRVALIVAGQHAGFSLDEMHRLMNENLTGPELQETMKRKAAQINLQIELLAAVRDHLEHAALCSASHLLECPHFLGHIRAALPATDEVRRASG